MKICFSVLAVLLAMVHTAFAEDASSSRVSVVYVHPDDFTDAGSWYLDDFRKHLRQRAERNVPQGQQLTVTITDIDMAGRPEPWRIPFSNVRIIRDLYPPRIDLQFRLADADGVLVKEGERKLRAPFFLTTTPLHRNDPLRYEKALIDSWLERELPDPGT